MHLLIQLSKLISHQTLMHFTVEFHLMNLDYVQRKDGQLTVKINLEYLTRQ